MRHIGILTKPVRKFARRVKKPLLVFFLAISLLLAEFPVNILFLKRIDLINEAKADSLPHVGFFSPERVWTAAGNANLNLRQPDPRNGDLLVALIAIRPSASTVNTPTGWTALGSWTGTDGGAEGVDAGSVSLYWFYKVADGTEGTANQTFTENGTTSVWQGTIMQLRSATGTYSVTSGGYSINGDATNWNGTLDTDIGLTDGDVVLVAGAQNGNLANSSAWDITATGITDKSTVIEHGEFSTGTGNDQETGLATTHIRAGTNTGTPTATLTQSAAASGVVSAFRIRQGAGTNRSDTWVRSAGAQIAGTTSVAVPYSEHEVGDLLVLFVGNRNDTATPSTPTDWTSLGTFSGGVGTFGADAGNARITAFYREATSEFTGTQSVTVSSSNTSVGQMATIHKDDVDSWTLDSDGGADNTAGTPWSVTGSGIDLASSDGGDIVLVGTSVNTDARLYSSHALSASGITFGDVTQTAEFRSTTGNDMTLELATGRVTAGSATGVAPTFTSTANGSATNNPAGSSLFVKVIGAAAANPTLTQNDWRIYVDNDATNPTDPWPSGALDLGENTTLTALPPSTDPLDPSDQIRIRMSIAVSTSTLNASSEGFILQYKEASDCTDATSWTDVDASGGGGTWRFFNAPGVTDGATITTVLTVSDVAGRVSESDPTSTNPNAVSSGQDLEWDWIVEYNGNAEAHTYCFRMRKDTPEDLDAYNSDSYPKVETRPGVGDLMRHGNFFSTFVEKGFFWAD